ncbi:DEAD-box ATP-dependent RNA helicase 5 [Selaginella moellendorffii]|uniref:DEAD-box ATP-dependent RNA helicase 5 n=1 Tax=Selaginella moellendorffii TaxID=88036 RepID=UPI000D1D059D|nr:DEAD-box ATP-dependent RNA helicase 5 [Selaginella moellendorffii]|eukprot:XP_024538089.1 DEAD-box ATP-dependent RNA helicase 5 [Selaginella moellendorffii]
MGKKRASDRAASDRAAAEDCDGDRCRIENAELRQKKKRKKKIDDDGEPEGENVVADEPKFGKKKKEKKRDHADNENAAIKGNSNGISDELYEPKSEKKEKDKGDRQIEVDDAASKEICNGKPKKVEDLLVSLNGRDSSNAKFQALESFSAAKLPADVMKCCSGFEKPSPIQAHSWPFLLDGRDLIGIAATGSGKTLAFGVPALVHILNHKKKEKKHSKGSRCLVLSPTRELAQQIAAVLEEAGASCGVKVVCLYGGSSKGPQYSSLRSGCDIVVATPGRLQDFVDEGVCKLDQITYLVLDEADRMLDLGFEPAVRAIVSHIPQERQTIMFSATWPTSVQKLAQEFIQDASPVKITVGSEDLSANHDVTQIVEVLDDKSRDRRLQELLRLYHKTKRNRVLVFVLYKKEAVRVENFLQKQGWNVTGIHGDKSQQARNQALSAFKDGSHPLLIATDVAARGLDIPDVEFVINYSFPLTTEDYVHRIGRTGRAGKKGTAHTFFTTADKARAGELVNILREARQIVPEELLKFGAHVKKKESKLYGAHFRELAADAPKAQKITFDVSDEE